MSGHFPFSGKAGRISVFAYFEAQNWSLAVQEKYYKRWYDWTKNYVMNDPDLKMAKAPEFAHYPYGTHAHHNFHLNDYYWAVMLVDLGQFINSNILPRLSDAEMHQLEEQHHHWLEDMAKEAEANPRPAPGEIGRYRHV